jgi:hypothetical protein
MAVISKRVFHPLPGKAELSLSRIRRLGEILTRLGGRVRVCMVAWGDGARDMHLYGVFPSFEAGGKAFTALSADPEAVKLRAEAEKEPASVWEGPEVWRTVYGEPQGTYSVMLHREYTMDRRNLRQAVELIPQAQALEPDRPMIGVIPVFSSDMSRLLIGYYANSLTDLGELTDRVGMSEAFQAIVTRAAALGTLTKARVLVNI